MTENVWSVKKVNKLISLENSLDNLRRRRCLRHKSLLFIYNVNVCSSSSSDEFKIAALKKGGHLPDIPKIE